MIEPRNAINLDELCWQKLITNGASNSEMDDDKAPVNTNWERGERSWEDKISKRLATVLSQNLGNCF